MIYLTSIPKDSYENATMWFLPGAALGGVFIPVAFASRAVPSSLADCSNVVLDRSKAMWAFRRRHQFAYPRWSHVKDAIRAVQAQADWCTAVISSVRVGSAPEVFAAAINQHASAVIQAWQNLYGS